MGVVPSRIARPLKPAKRVSSRYRDVRKRPLFSNLRKDWPTQDGKWAPSAPQVLSREAFSDKSSIAKPRLPPLNPASFL